MTKSAWDLFAKSDELHKHFVNYSLLYFGLLKGDRNSWEWKDNFDTFIRLYNRMTDFLLGCSVFADEYYLKGIDEILSDIHGKMNFIK